MRDRSGSVARSDSLGHCEYDRNTGDYLVYVLRPNGVSLWLPSKLLLDMGIQRGQQLAEKQYGDERIQSLLLQRQKPR